MVSHGTYSIVGVDSEAGEVGVAVQSRSFAVGAVVSWARAGVGAVATQAFCVASYGPQILALLEEGVAPEDAIERVLANDDRREQRQIGVVAADGGTAVWTGSECPDWAGHADGDGWTAQGNTLAGQAVVRAMAEAFQGTDGDLAEKLMCALEAAEAAGGDRRGRQAAGLIVERRGWAERSSDRIDRLIDLRVDDHPEPIEELRRLLDLRRAYAAGEESFRLYEQGDPAAAADVLAQHVDGPSVLPEVLYNLACFEALAGRHDDAFVHLEAALDRDGGLKTLARDDSDLAPLREDERYQRLVA